MKTKYIVELRDEQREHLEKISSTGRYPARQIKRAQILLKSDQKINWSYKQISDAFDVSDVTIAKVRKGFKEQVMVKLLDPEIDQNKKWGSFVPGR